MIDIGLVGALLRRPKALGRYIRATADRMERSGELRAIEASAEWSIGVLTIALLMFWIASL